MSLRIFETLAKWTTLEETKLVEAIQKTGAAIPDDLNEARRLFVRTVETPGGLKVQTIHAFCERLLHLFPFEANVSARFEAIDEETQQALMDAARKTVMSGGGDLPTGIGAALAIIAEETGSDGFESLLQKVVTKRSALRRANALQDNGLRDALGRNLGIAGNIDPGHVIAEIFDGGIGDDRLTQIIDELMQSSSKDNKLAAKIRNALQEQDPIARAHTYIASFFTTKDERPINIVTQKISPLTRADLEAEQDRLEVLRDKLRAAETLERTHALYVLGDAVQAEYERLKGVRGFLDFDDMIERTRTLLTRSDAQWVLFKLDSGIDHILVDEAQDTSPAQWAILKALTEEFFSGRTAREGNRTFFAVGDEKQSIFSFQGAAPQEFGANRKIFRESIEDIKLTFADVELQESFRSSQVILEAVDKVFKNNGVGLTSDGVIPPHTARKSWLPGYIELWPLIAKDNEPIPESWRLPVDALRANDPAALMANRVADSIAALLDPANRHGVFDQNNAMRPVAPGDIMILVRKRGPFFSAVIRAMKERHIPVAGADRIKIADHIAVMDLVAVGKVALLPVDDLTLATVLKCPFIGLDDDDLLDIAPRRGGSLFAALQASEKTSHRKAAALIAEWSAIARYQTPFEFYADLLGRQGGRRALLARLGPEAGDAIDEFMRLALDSKAASNLTLAQFIHRLEETEMEIKRDMEGAGNAVRVMTVHAAKGLEAKIVYLPDTCTKPGGGHAENIIDIGTNDDEPDAFFLWRKNAKTDPALAGPVLEAIKIAEAEEHRRLLYVAMTRAEERLYIGGFHGKQAPKDDIWYKMIESELAGDAAPLTGDGPSFIEGALAIGMPSQLMQASAQTVAVANDATTEAWMHQAARRERPAAPPVRPSTALASADQLEPRSQVRKKDAYNRGGAAIGRLVHELLYRLPAMDHADRAAAAERYLNARGGSLPQAMKQRLLNDVLAILDSPDVTPLFGKGSRAEVAVSGSIADGNGGTIEVTGRIDRLRVTADAVLVVDFKTGAGRPAGETPPAYLRQMALYRSVLRDLFPDLPVRVFLIWTGGPTITELPADMLELPL